jgi:hypothetical protein
MRKTPADVLPFRCRSAGRTAPRPGNGGTVTLLNDLAATGAGLDAGFTPGEIREIEASRCRAQIEHAAQRLAQYTTPHAAATFLRKMADQMEMPNAG